MTMNDFNLGKKVNYDTYTKTILSNSTEYFNHEEVLSINYI